MLVFHLSVISRAELAMLVKERLFWHNISMVGFFFTEQSCSFLVWVMPLAHQTIKSIVSSSPGQVQLCVEPQAEEDQQVHGTG